VTTKNQLGTILHSAGDGHWQPVHTESGYEPWVIWGSGPGDVYAILSPDSFAGPSARVLHSKKSGAWVTEPVSDVPTMLVALWGSGPDDVYVGGWQESSATGRVGVLFESAGDGQWLPVSLPGTVYDVRCIWGSGPNDVYVGVYDFNDGPVLLHGQR
jgi:hypothetical protein